MAPVHSNKTPAVSVVVSFFNAERYFEEAIDGVYLQTYKDWELLLIDDGSSDDSTAIALNYARKDPDKVKYFEHRGHRNCGQAASRNVGLEHARGKYIAVLDADDVWLSHKLDEQLALMKANPRASMVCGNSEYWHSWNVDSSGGEPDSVPASVVPTNMMYEPPALLPLRVNGEWSPCPSDFLFKRQAAIDFGGFEASFSGIYGMYEDQAFLTKVSLHWAVYLAEACWTRYRVHRDSICSVQRIEGREPAICRFYLRWLERYLADNGVNDREIMRKIRLARWNSRRRSLSRAAKSVLDPRTYSRLTGSSQA